jgi:HSP20 family protein
MLAFRAPLADFAFDEPFRTVFDAALRGAPAPWQHVSPPADIRETADAYVLEIDVPGLSERDIEVVLENGELTLRGERKPAEGASYSCRERAMGRFERSFRLADDVDSKRIEASAKNGVLTVKLPKAEQAKPRSIEVKAE